MSEQETFRAAADDPAHAARSAEQRRDLLRAALIATGFADRAAFRRVYQMTSAKLFGICLRICGERQAAEDVLQEVYLIIWRRAPSFEPLRASPITWLAAIARNRAVDWRRASGRVPPAPLAGERGVSAIAPIDASLAADAAIIEEEEATRLRACLGQLDERARTAIRSAFMDGLTYGELAQRNGVPLATMKSIVRRGLLRLRDCLDDDA